MVGGKNKIELLYRDLTFKIIGVLYDVFNELGPGLRESTYERAIAKDLKDVGFSFRRQLPYKVTYKGEIVGRYYFDFLVEGKVILELKQGDYFSRRNIHQLSEYLKATKLKLGILANFTSTGVKYKRIVNISKSVYPYLSVIRS